MPLPINLYVDRLSPTMPVRVADVYDATRDRSSTYNEAAAKVGLTPAEYREFRRALQDGGALYVRLPRRLDSMAGVHRNGRVYALDNVAIPAGTMGWEVDLADGTQVFVPQVCGNLSVLRHGAVAAKPRPQVRPVAVVAMRPQPHAVRAVSYTAPAAVAPPAGAAAPAAPTPVTFAPPPAAEAPQTVAAAPAAVPAAAAGPAGGRTSGLPFLGLLAPLFGAFHDHGSSSGPAPSSPVLPPCSGGSNAMGVCQK